MYDTACRVSDAVKGVEEDGGSGKNSVKCSLRVPRGGREVVGGVCTEGEGMWEDIAGKEDKYG